MRLLSLSATVVMASACSRELVSLLEQDEGTAPTVSSFAPLAGLAGETVVRVEGKNFPAGARVYFGAQEGVWAVGPAYEYSDTVVYGIPPFGTEAVVEISVRGTSGEGRARELFRLFDSPPTIVELSTERVTRDSRLVIRGRSFNPDDLGAQLVIASAEIIDFTVTPDTIVADLGSAVGFSSIGTGWRILRYRYTPYTESDPGEAAVPIYVVQPPEIASVDRLAYVGGGLELEIQNYDAFEPLPGASAADNAISIGGTLAAIEAVRPGSAPDLTAVRATVPAIAVGSALVSVRNLAGESEVVGVSIQAGGRPRPGAELADCRDLAAAGRSAVFQDVGENSVRYVLPIPTSTGDVLATIERGSIAAAWSDAALGLAAPFYVHAATWLPVQQYTVALIGDSEPGSGVPVSAWRLVVVRGDRARVFDLPICSGSCFAEPGRPPRFLSRSRDILSPSVALLFQGTFMDARGVLLVLRFPSESRLEIDPLEAWQVPYVAAEAPIDVELTGDGDFRAILAFTNELQIWRVGTSGTSLTGTRAAAYLQTLGSGPSRHYGLDVGYVPRRGVLIDAATPSFAEFSLPAPSFSDQIADAAVASANAYWWLGIDSDPRLLGYSAESAAIAPTQLLLPTTHTLRRVVTDAYHPRLVVMGDSASTLLVGIRGGAAPGEASVMYEVVGPGLGYEPLSVGLDWDDTFFLYQPSGYLEHAAASRTTVARGYGLNAQQLLEMDGTAVATSLPSLESYLDPAPGRSLVWRWSDYGGYPLGYGVAPLALPTGTAYPARFVAAPELNRFFGALYRQDGPEQVIDVLSFSSQWNEATCALATVRLPAPLRTDIPNALSTGQLAIDIVAPVGTSLFEEGIPVSKPRELFVLASGPILSGVFSFTLPESGMGPDCPAAPVAMTELVAADAAGPITTASVDARGRWLAVVRNNGLAVMELGRADRSLVAADLPRECPYSIDRVVATADGVILRGDSETLCRVELPAGYSGTPLALRFVTELTGPCYDAGRQPRSLVLSPDEADLWAGVNDFTGQVLLLDSLCQLSASTGELRGSLALYPRAAIDLAFDPESGALDLLTVLPDDGRDSVGVLGGVATERCEIR